MIARQLKERWQTEAGIELTRQILYAFKHKKTFDSIEGLPKTGGKWDLQGLYVPHWNKATDGEGIFKKNLIFEITRINLKDVNFSYADLSQTNWRHCTFENCYFEHVDLQYASFTNCDFSTIDFVKTNFTGAFLNLNHGKKSGSFKNVNFIKSKLRDNVFNFPTLENCSFIDCQLIRVEFDGSQFSNCTFVGWIGPDVSFRKHSSYSVESFLYFFNRFTPTQIENRMINIDFTEADLEAVSFDPKLDLSNCLLPAYFRIR